MNEQQLAAVKQALEALEFFKGLALSIEEIERAEEAITDLQSIISQDALHEMAEESRTIGLRLDDWDKIGCVNHDCDKCKAVQEPVAQSLKDAVFTVIEGFTLPHDVRKILESAYYNAPPAPQPVPVKTYHDGKPWPVQPSQSAPDYAWPTIEDYEKEVGFEVNDAFKAAWTMARTTNDLFKQMGENT
jgi:hypothetical protein